MSTLGERLDAAIKSSGKTREQVAEEALSSVQTISRITTGAHDNPELQLLLRLARAANTTVGGLLGESIALSAEDERELLRLRQWADDKLATLDARQEPNAVVIATRVDDTRISRVADRKSPPKIENPFDPTVSLVLRAVGESMKDDGILPDDTLYAVPPGDPDSAAGTIIACRIGNDVFVKRLVVEHGRYYLRSGHSRYLPIAVDPADEAFHLLGVVVGRNGRVS